MPRYLRVVLVVVLLALTAGVLYLNAVILPCARRPSCAGLLATETQLWSAIAATAFTVVAIVQTIVLAGTWIAIRESTREASLLRQETAGQAREIAKQVRLAAMPILAIILHKEPDQVRIRNIATASAASAASRILLQAFAFSWGGSTWRCVFEPTGLLAPGHEARLKANIREPLPTREHAVLGTPVFTALFTTAFRYAFSAGSEDLILALYFEDMLGNCYRSDVRIDPNEMHQFLETGPQVLQLEIVRTTLEDTFPQSLAPVDRSEAPIPG
jgi:hypothetical protein